MNSPEGNSPTVPVVRLEGSASDLSKSHSTDKIPKSVSFPLSEIRSKSSPLLLANNLRDNPNLMAAMRRKPSITYPPDTRMILVDRDLQNLQWAKDYLHRLGYETVVLVKTGTEALEVLRNSTEKFHIVVADIYLPDMAGVDLIPEIKKISQDITIFMMSPTEDLDTVYQCLKSGADHYILKPLKEDHLRNLFQSVYRKKQESEALAKLNNEMSKSTRLEEKTAKLENEITALKQAIDEAIETPIRIISKEIETIFSQQTLPSEVILSTILKQLRDVDIYQPAFRKLLYEANSNNAPTEGTFHSPRRNSTASSNLFDGIEPTTRRWLLGILVTPLLTDVKQEELKGINKNGSHEWVTNEQRDEKQIIQWQKDLRSFSFDVWKLDNDTELVPMIIDMFTHNHVLNNLENGEDYGVDLGGNLLETFQVPIDKFTRFVHDIKNNYPDKNPYHNFKHAFDVVQTTFVLLTRGRAAEHLSPLESFSLLIAALVHDVSHPGLNNNYQVATSSPLALRYNDRSVLENHHCTTAFSIMRKPENDFTCNLTPEQKKEMRNIVVNSVLATDLASHMEIMAKWNSIVDDFSSEQKEHRLLLLQILLKTADISNPGKPFELAKTWAHIIQEEMFIQGDTEKKQELKISPFMDRDQPALPRMQVNFIEYIVAPLITSLYKFLSDILPLVERLGDNKMKWKTILEGSVDVN